MFRNPRENASVEVPTPVLPSRGRPPTPPMNSLASQSSYFTQTPVSTSKSSPISASQLPTLGRHGTSKIPGGKKNGGKQNQSILNFFGKAPVSEIADENAAELGLFFEDVSPEKAYLSPGKRTNALLEDDSVRFNEEPTPVKKRRIDSPKEAPLRTPSPELDSNEDAACVTFPSAASLPIEKKQKKHRAGFIDDSSDEEEAIQPPPIDVVEDEGAKSDFKSASQGPVTRDPDIDNNEEITLITKVPLKPSDDGSPVAFTSRREPSCSDAVPTLTRESTSMFAPGEFGDEDDFEDDEFFQEGEEYLERRWMEEQRDMEIGLEDDSKSEYGTEEPSTPHSGVNDIESIDDTSQQSVSSCPICSGNMSGLSEVQASSHVNACLDGTAPPLPKIEDTPAQKTKRERSSTPQFSNSAKRFQRAAIARPGQANPFDMSADKKAKGSAFTRLMSGHAEDAAWAEAAANEHLSRGKPAYARTCPFYKIMPGLYVCVDAFRYGKVAGQNAYFLSHFHSDHYIGLTSTWSHGPIYASKVSCNLMRQQLKVDPKWLNPLEFEQTVEVPNTKGVFVTMIPANHCPGSSLFLFEKEIGKNKDGSPKKTRILHCGDFRACPAHVHHPLLKPEVRDAITGKIKDQVIDTCYLDTTYLTPKFSFPSQHDVIDACANMCVSLSRDIPDINDNWEQVKMAKAGSIMTNFLDEGKKDIVKKEEDAETEDQKPKLRGRLLVVCGTYSIGKERICMGIARALKSKIYAPPAKMRICKALEDSDLNALLTSDPLQAQVHMQMLMEIRAETLHDYLITFKGQFSRVVGFRPTGWTYRPPSSRFTDNPTVHNVLHSEGWKSRFTMKDLAPQRGSTKESNCFGVPYSEHSSFRELTMFCCALRINRIVPTVNVGSAKSRERMKGWVEKWDAEKKKNGLYTVEVGAEGWGSGDGQLRYGV